MQTTLERVPEETLFEATPLTNTLFLAGVMPFRHDTVENYKDEMVERHPPNFWYRHEKLFQTLLTVASSVLLMFSIISVVASFVALLFFAIINAENTMNFLALGGIVASPLFYFGSKFMKTIEDSIIVRGPAQWNMVTLEAYIFDGKRISAKADEVVRHIKDTSFGAQFFVEELRQDEYILDPFLIVSDPKTGNRHYICQWDEPLFNED